uniref:Dynein axonemal heavy chain 17 n=1 Tax=Sinocyclocheilus grahami TaxID=75366 RepID=A0A672SZQ6_SINGR
MENESHKVDQRFEFLEKCVSKAFNVKSDRWQKCVATEEQRQLIQDFLDKSEHKTLVISLNSSGQLIPALGLSGTGKNKSVYFVKLCKTALSADKMKTQLFCGDVCHSPLEQFSVLVEKVVEPVLSNARNHRDFPHVVSQDLMRHIHVLKNNVFVIAGQVKGKTHLPVPPGFEQFEPVAHEGDKSGHLVDKRLIHSMETVVIDWSHQVYKVLKKDSSEPLLEGKNPTPHAEIKFWKNRLADLQGIHNQFQSPRVLMLAELLAAVDSSYYPAFAKMLRDVSEARSETRDINTFLKPIEKLVEDVENADFSEVKGKIAPLMHTVCLIWANSKYYNSPARIIVLLQEICNLLIQQARSFLNPEDVLKGDVLESLSRVQMAIDGLTHFKSTYENRRANLSQYQRNQNEVKPWDFSPLLVFVGLDHFMKRLRTIETLLLTVVDMMKLEKVEFGGILGKSLSQRVQFLHEDFLETYKTFSEKPYDCLDVSNVEFEADFMEFQLKVENTERQLSTIFCHAFDDAAGLEHAFKVLDMFGRLLERPLIAADAHTRYRMLIKMFDKQLECCKLIFKQQMQTGETQGYSPVSKNMPVVAGGLKFVQQLKERIQIPYNNFRFINHPCMESADGKETIQKYDELMQLLKGSVKILYKIAELGRLLTNCNFNSPAAFITRYSSKLYDVWTSSVAEKSQFNLQKPLISREQRTRLISVNFSPQLVSVLREVKYLEARQAEVIPDMAADIYSNRELLWQYVANLELTTNWYNKVMSSMLEVEMPLIQSQLTDIDAKLKEAEENLCWTSQGIWEYIQDIRETVYDLEQRLQRTKDNVEEIQTIMKSWTTPVFERKEGKKDTLLNLEDKTERLERTYGQIRASGTKIHLLLKDNMSLFKADPSSARWKVYVDYIDEMVIDGFYNAVESSLKFFLDNTDQKAGLAPLFEVQLLLQVPEIVFYPSLEFSASGGFHDLVESLINSVFRISALVPRLSEHSGFPHYQADMEDMVDFAEWRHLLMERVRKVMGQCCEYRNSLEHYAYLYVDDRKEFMRQFLLYGHVLTSEEIEAHAEHGVPETPPTLECFRKQVDSYELLYEEVQRLEPVHVFESWMRVDARAFKSALLNVIRKWSFMFKQHLIDHVTHSLSDLEEFIGLTEAGLGKKVEEGDYNGLVDIMGYLMAVKERQSTTDEMFEPLQHTIDLLKTYEQELPELVYKQLEVLPEKWNNMKKQAVLVKQHVAPLQAGEVANLRRKCAAFDVEQHTFREQFRKKDFFRFDCVNPHEMLDEAHDQIQEMETTMAGLIVSANLFEVNISDYRQLKQCRKELPILKELWDLVLVVQSCLEAWQMTPWRQINVDDMEMECKRFSKELRTLDKEARPWDAFSGLDGTVKNTLVSLRAVAELQNPAIRPRHWQQLMNATGVRFTMDKDTTLADLLRLNLHHFEDEVRGIVDRAVKEMGMEKVLSELDATWISMAFDFEPHPRTNIPLLKSSEELIETLEDNQVQLQNLMTSKYISFFLEEVSTWQRKLSVTDSVISIWFEVQRTWSHLESIFIGSDDIRSQLPEDSKRFDGIDTDFKELTHDASKTPNVVEATNKPGLYDKLEDIQGRLSRCEKALAEYLDTKRLAFPRFYFISSADLLDILSSGTDPHQVQKHLSKLFDNMAKLKFEMDAGGKPTKTGLGMFSKEDEYVQFNAPCDCTGQVEVWLNRVLDSMRATVRHEMTEAVAAYEEKPREQWLFDYPAQVALTCTQIWWTTDVGMAFSRLEEGYENAMKDYYKKQVSQLNTLITMLIGQLTTGDRQKVMTICTIDVHARDVVDKIIQQKVENSQAFLWLSQLRHRWGEREKHCFANICDAQFLYSYEYLGNTPRLSCGNIYKGLAQTGAWGCFDEFNRISVEVLSVVAVQVKSIQDAIRDKKKRFNFMGEDVNLVPSVGIFITMNPGYAGRTELPENLKALFRPCAMVVPDFELICEIMLVAEGFLEARLLARKFITLYQLCKELLSKQDHYDWGLRAIKSVLVVAGSLKRGDPGRAEDQVLMRALRDFNVPKIVTDDMPVFMGLIGDLFPALDVPRKRDMDFEKFVKQSVLDLKLQAEDNFVLKVVQLEELLAVRHSVFVVGNAGTGKSQVLKSLHKTYQNMKRRAMWADLNPKAVTNDELFGIINPATREWKDGLFSNIMRELANISHTGPKWIVLDGDIDPMWIESLNTVMDDNKVLTLASNERIPLNPSMRLVFEISHLRTATPATVSRAGILYINPADLGWNPPVSSWIDGREVQSEKANLTILFDKYLPSCLDTLRSRFKKIIPVPEQSMVQMLCFLLECLLIPEHTPPDSHKDLYELYFVFAAIWAFGGTMFQDQLVDYRVEFSKWWVTEFKTVKFPAQGTVFDYYIDPESKKFEPWSKMIPKFVMDPDIPLQACLVHTTETIRVRYFMDSLLERRRPVMLVGNAGTGKSVLVGDKLGSLDPEKYAIKNVPFNYYTTSAMLQGVSCLAMYDRSKLQLKEIHNVQYVSCMNPTAGSFTINPRLQRHFSVFALSFPGVDALNTIYCSILSQHLRGEGFPAVLQKSCSQLVQLALAFHQRVTATFLPTAIKFHYIFNLRDLSNIFQGILFCTSECLKTSQDLVKIFLHESNRVYRDKMVEDKDFDIFDKLQSETVKKSYEDMEETLEETRAMNMYCHFATGIGEPKYMVVQSWGSLNKTLLEALDGYNEVNAAINLVLFEDAMSHICRINRILESPRGNALLVGVGGSGKQSLTRLAAFISSLEVFQITLKKGYGIPDLKSDLGALYIKAGVKNIGMVLLMTDAQVADEKFLVLVNDLLASGEIPDLFPDDEVENIIGSLRNEVRGQGLMDTRENCWKFFIDRVRRQLKVALCFSPVGSKLRVRSRKFPAVVNCTAIDWFHEWPQEALESVSLRFLQDVEHIQPEVKDSVSKFMAYVHISVNKTSKDYLANERRYNYTTPKSFLEQIKLYGNLLALKKKDLTSKMERLENGLEKLNSTTAQVRLFPTFKMFNLKLIKLLLVCVQLKWSRINSFFLHLYYIHLLFKNEFVTPRFSLKLITEDKRWKVLKNLKEQLNENLAKLTAKFEKATADKLRCQQEAETTARTIALANRLVGGLASENVRWAEAVKSFRHQESTLCGDVLLITAFVSYLGYFTKRYRLELMDNSWRPYLSQLKVPIPVTPGLDPLTMLTDDADIAGWQNEGLPADRMSTENATILTSCERWPLMVDPQLQGIKWIKSKYGEELRLIRIGQRGYLDSIERALSVGEVVLIENLEEAVDPVLGPLLGRETIKKGRYIKIGDKECEYNPSFRLILHTKLANPHYQPELQAQCTLVNFTVTRDGLEDQLLAAVVSMERPDLEELKSNLTKQQNGFKITLKTLEDNLLSRLSSASGNFLGDIELVENLEITKRTAAEIEVKVKEAKVTEAEINDAREHYRLAAARGSLLYFIMNDLNKIHPMYQFSLKAFNVVFQNAVLKADPDETVKQRVLNLIDSITSLVFQYTTRGLFECDKLTYTAQLAFQVLLMNKEINPRELDFLLRYPVQPGLMSPVDFLSNHSWGGIKALSTMEEFHNLDRDIEGSAKRWKKFSESECPEKEKFPQEWKNKTSLQRLCMMRALRPDRMTYAVRSIRPSASYLSVCRHVFPGVKLGYTFDNRNFHNVSLGQGQEVVAEQALDLAAKEGHWVILQNIHLVAKWLGMLEKKLEQHAEGSHLNFRVFVSAEPSSSPDGHIIPQGILENSIKITNEPPMGMHANLHKALDNFNQDTLEMCARENEFKSILFALCYFHAVVAERRKFGPQGWNRSYPFNTGDLTISVNVLYNYLEANTKVRELLCYFLWKVMHCVISALLFVIWAGFAYLFFNNKKTPKNYIFAPLHYSCTPHPLSLDLFQYIDGALPPESPYLYGLHPNAEIGFLTQTSEKLFRTVLEMQPRDGGSGEGTSGSRDEKVKAALDEILEKLPEEFNLAEMMGKVEERTPYIVVAFQECERMNFLTQEIKRSLKELSLGLKGELTMTNDMENLQNAIYLDQVPESWTKRAYPSISGLAIWFMDLLNRIKELEIWTSDFSLPSVVWLAGFFNPQSFLTAIMQSMARRNEWPLDKMSLQCDVTKKNREDFSSPPREGAYIHGLFMEGARWDTQAGIMVDARLKELTPTMPVIFIKAIPVDKQETRSLYQCPVYKTRQRGPTYVWTFNLKTKENPSKWTLAGVALLLQI